MRLSIGAALATLAESMAETMWPARFAVCDKPGQVICERCLLTLPYIDRLKACPACGAAFGITVCTECNSATLAWRELDSFGIDACASATRLTEKTRRIIVTYKDKGEMRLADPIAALMARALPRAWRSGTLVPIPARRDAREERGFDHIETLSRAIGIATELPTENLLAANRRKDQRSLEAKQRSRNAKAAFSLASPSRIPKEVIIVDDVFTTGATLRGAAQVLREAGAETVRALVFARA